MNILARLIFGIVTYLVVSYGVHVLGGPPWAACGLGLNAFFTMMSWGKS